MSKNKNEGVNKIGINWYPGHMAKTKRLISEKLDLIDIVIEVIDARIPYSSRIRDLDNLVKNKPRLIVMTKYDLCDKKETDKWVNKYQNDGYKVLTLDLTLNSNIDKLISKEIDEIMIEINAKRSAKGLSKNRPKVLIVGVPNAGKSTLINRLVGKKVVNVGNKPGVTKDLSWIRVNNNFELLDTPGILWPKITEEKVGFNLASFTAIKEEILPLDEVSTYILKMLYRYYPVKLKERYGVDSIDDEEIVEVYDIIGRKFGCLIRGGNIDYDKVIGIIINDIKNGNVKGITFDRFDNN